MIFFYNIYADLARKHPLAQFENPSARIFGKNWIYFWNTFCLEFQARQMRELNFNFSDKSNESRLLRIRLNNTYDYFMKHSRSPELSATIRNIFEEHSKNTQSIKKKKVFSAARVLPSPIV